VEQLLGLAARQHGVVSLQQVRQLGVTRGQLRTAVRHGTLVAVAPRVYAVGGAPSNIEQRQMSGLLCLGDGALLSHEAAARLHRFDRSLPDTVEFMVPRVQHGRRTPFVVHTTSRLTALDRVTVEGWPCTSATRTVIDLAGMGISEVRLEAAIDSAVRTGASAPLAIAKRLEELRGPGGRGAPLLDRLLVDAGGHTVLERRFLHLMREAGLPRPTTQLVHRHGARTVARVDFCFEAYCIVVEVSGGRGHSSPVERARDAQRRNELQELGRQVYEFTFDQVTRRSAFVQATVRRCLERAGWTASRPRTGPQATNPRTRRPES
jgi:hypothetical protein